MTPLCAEPPKRPKVTYAQIVGPSGRPECPAHDTNGLRPAESAATGWRRFAGSGERPLLVVAAVTSHTSSSAPLARPGGWSPAVTSRHRPDRTRTGVTIPTPAPRDVGRRPERGPAGRGGTTRHRR